MAVALGEVVPLECRRLVRVEAVAVVDHLDDDPVGAQLVADVDLPLTRRAVRVPHRVGHRLGERELQVGHRVVADLPELAEPRQGEPAQRDVFGLRRNAKLDRPAEIQANQASNDLVLRPTCDVDLRR